jgi:arylsulfatase
VADGGALRHEPAQLTDVMATVLDLTGATYLAERDGAATLPPEGCSLMPVIASATARRAAPLFFEHEGNAAVREGRWKLVRNFSGARSAVPDYDRDDPTARGCWELYDMTTDRTELHDLAETETPRADRLHELWNKWAENSGVKPWPVKKNASN